MTNSHVTGQPGEVAPTLVLLWAIIRKKWANVVLWTELEQQPQQRVWGCRSYRDLCKLEKHSFSDWHDSAEAAGSTPLSKGSSFVFLH